MSLLSDFSGKPIKPRGVKPTSTESAEVLRAKRALLRRAKVSERDFAKWLIKHDGPDPKYRGLTTSTGRIGHITNIRADCLSMSYLGENKNAKLPAGIAGFWQLINEKAIEWGKDPILRWEPSNASDYKVAGKPLPDLHIITESRHSELLRKEQLYDASVSV